MSPKDTNGGRSDHSVQKDERPTNKVARLLEEYDLGADFGDRLEELWTADGDERMSLRSLARLFNERLLETEMDRAGLSTLEGEVTNIYRLLTDEEISSGMRLEARNWLQMEGVDVEQLEQDFVTYQAIRSYLKDHRGAEYDAANNTKRPDDVIETVQRLEARTEAVVRNSLEQLEKTEQISLGEFQLFIQLDVFCSDCGSQYNVVELLRRGGCECESS